MKHRFFLIALLFCCILGGAAALFTVFTAEIATATRTPGYSDLTERFETPIDPDEALRWTELGKVARKGPEALLNQIREEQTPAPLIYSRWFVDERIARVSESRAEVERAIREFGRAWLVQLEEESRTLRALKTNEEREAKARTLLDLADWIGSAGGYGNVWLFYRLQDLANIPIGYLLSDNDYPMASLEQLVPRLLKNIDIYTKIGIPALNSEAPEPVFKLGEVKPDPKFGPPRTNGDREDDIQGPAFAAWHKKLAEATKQLRKTQKEGEYVGILSGEKKRSRLPDDLQFFIDDEDKITSRPFTAVEQWDVKFHYKFLLGLVGSKVDDSLAFLEFRRRVGTIPEPYVFTPEEIAQGEKEKEDYAKRGVKVVPFWEIPDFDAREFAFEKAWKALPGLTDDNRNDYYGAYWIFKLVQENKLYDDDYEESKKGEKKQAIREKNDRIQQLDKQLYQELDAAREEWAKASLHAEQKDFELYLLSREEGKEEELEKVKLEEKEAREKAQKALEKYKEADSNYKNLYKDEPSFPNPEPTTTRPRPTTPDTREKL